jgi:hypothetical protein
LGVAEDVVFQKNEDDPYITVRDVRAPPSPPIPSPPLPTWCNHQQQQRPRECDVPLLVAGGGGEKGSHARARVRQEDDTDDLDDFTIRTTDALLVTGTAEDDYSHLDVHIYEEPDDNIYVHHDIMLPTYPLSLAWTDSLPGRTQGTSPPSLPPPPRA